MNIEDFMTKEDLQRLKDLRNQIDKAKWEKGTLQTKISDLNTYIDHWKEEMCRLENKARLLYYANCPHEFELTITGSGSCRYDRWCEHGRSIGYHASYYMGEQLHHMICKICGL